jgi:hypothetical protein
VSHRSRRFSLRLRDRSGFREGRSPSGEFMASPLLHGFAGPLMCAEKMAGSPNAQPVLPLFLQ